MYAERPRLGALGSNNSLAIGLLGCNSCKAKGQHTLLALSLLDLAGLSALGSFLRHDAEIYDRLELAIQLSKHS